ncbi:MAG: DinB family protein [Bacteroidota bacterium]
MKNASALDLMKIYQACCTPLYEVLENLPDKQFHWKPAPDARSIAEIFRHLIRVDAMIFKEFGHSLPPDPGGEADAETLLAAFKTSNRQIISLLENLENDADLAQPTTKIIMEGHDNLGEWLVHLSQHYLYHFAQVAYLRRAQDRNWVSPNKRWEEATYVISNNLQAMSPVLKIIAATANPPIQ